MKQLLMILALVVAGRTVSGGAEAIEVSPIPDSQIIDGTHFQRRNSGEIEVFVVGQVSGGLLIFYLNGKPVAKLSAGEGIRLYLSPGRYRFGVIPSSHVVLFPLSQIDVQVARNAPRVYGIVHSGGYNSGWGAAFEIVALKNVEPK